MFVENKCWKCHFSPPEEDSDVAGRAEREDDEGERVERGVGGEGPRQQGAQGSTGHEVSLNQLNCICNWMVDCLGIGRISTSWMSGIVVFEGWIILFMDLQKTKVATDTNILDPRTRYRTKLGWFFWFWPIQRYDTTKGKWQILYLRTRYRSKLGWFFWFGPIHVTIRHNLGSMMIFLRLWSLLKEHK